MHLFPQLLDIAAVSLNMAAYRDRQFLAVIGDEVLGNLLSNSSALSAMAQQKLIYLSPI